MANVYWFGGTGNWSDQANHWSNNSGNAPASLHGSEPGTDDDVVFDTLSNATAYTVTIDSAAGTRACQNFTMGAPLAGKVTWAGSSALNIYGNLNLSGGTAGITMTYSGFMTFMATSGTKTLTTNSVPITSFIVFNGLGGTFQLSDSLTARTMYLTAGTFDATTNNTTVFLTAAIANFSLYGNFTFYNLTRIGVTIKTGTLILDGNITVTNMLTITGNSVVERILVQSLTIGTPRTITAAAISVSNADFQDIIGAGAASWDMSAASGGSGNCGGNSMKALGDAAFTTAATQTWTNTSGGDWSLNTNWTSRIPLPQDNVSMACAFTASRTVTADMPRLGKSIDWTGATWTTALTWAISNNVFYGSLIMIDNLSVSGTSVITFSGRSSYTFTPHSISFPHSITVNAPTGTLTLGGDLTLATTKTLQITNGTFSTVNGGNNYIISAGLIRTDAGGTLTLGSATHLITGTTGNVWEMNASGTLTVNTSTLKLTGALTAAISFVGGGKTTYNNVWNATTNAYVLTVSNNNTFNDFRIDAGREVNFINASTTTVTTFTALGTVDAHIVIHSTSATHAILAKAGGGYITDCDYIDIQEMTGSPVATWYIGPNSTDAGVTCTNIYLSNSPPPTSNFKTAFRNPLRPSIFMPGNAK